MIAYPGDYLRMAGRVVEYQVTYPNGFTRVSHGRLVSIEPMDHLDHQHLAPGEEAYTLLFDDLGLHVDGFGDKGRGSIETLELIR